ASGDVARQLLMLPPGLYRLGLLAGDVRGAVSERPKITVVCGPSNAALLDGPLPEAPASGSPQSFEFSVPIGGCGIQWLVVTARGMNSDAGSTSWIDNVSIMH